MLLEMNASNSFGKHTETNRLFGAQGRLENTNKIQSKPDIQIQINNNKYRMMWPYMRLYQMKME